MADYAKLVRDGVKLANTMTASLQADVQYYKAGEMSGGGDIEYPATPELWPAIIEWKQKMVRTVTGVEAVSRAMVTFLEPHDIDEKDKMVLPDGTTGPILDMTGLVDPATGRAYFTTVWLG